MSAPWSPLRRSMARRLPQVLKTSCCGEPWSKTWLNCQLRMPMPADTVSNDPDGPGVRERTDVTNPAAPAASPLASVEAADGSSSAGLPLALWFCFISNAIASFCVRPGLPCLSNAKRWCNGSDTSVPCSRAAGAEPVSLLGAAGRIRQKAARWKVAGLAGEAPARPPEDFLKRWRSGQSSAKKARQSQASRTGGMKRHASTLRHSHAQCQ
mmetsp:Transcript_40605/g.129031  ORF Transcript_40605/g.129031 Transcript_40605/m.129031 type:complete len:211 (+) Transcript_40605:1285-1917(+)